MIAQWITALVAWFTGLESNIIAKLLGAFNFILTSLTADEQQILHDASQNALTDINNGKSIGQAMADGWTVFYNEERSEASKVGKALFTAFCTALGG